MAVSTSYAEYVMEQLNQVTKVSSKRMFGGIGIYAGEFFFALIDNDRLYLKVDDTNRSDFENAGMKPFKPFADKPMTMQYFELPEAALEDIDELSRWIKKAVLVAQHTKTKPRVRKKKSK